MADTYIIQNVSGGPLTIADLDGVEIPTGESITAYSPTTEAVFTPDQITLSNDLRAAITGGDVTINDGTADLTTEQALQSTDVPNINTYVRENFYLIKKKEDLPAPVAGVITLEDSSIYEINGTIMLGTDRS